MGSRRRGGRGGEKGVKNIGAEETGGKNRAVSTEAAGYVERDGREEDGTARREEGVKKERSRWWWANGTRTVGIRERKNRRGR